jgi:negative regulator of flagellin synthesis FlgM
MSFASGIGSVQQAINSITPSEAKPAIRTSVSDGEITEKLIATDQTNLSSTGGLVAQALESSDIRSAKVASLQQAIAAGSYNVSSSDVADKIIQSLLD